MAWFWTDDVARTLIDAKDIDAHQVQDWLSQPVAIAAPDGTDPRDLGRELLGLDSQRDVGAA